MRAALLAVLLSSCVVTEGADAGHTDVTSLSDAGGPRETDCTNGTDDDADGVADCEDVDCRVDPACRSTPSRRPKVGR